MDVRRIIADIDAEIAKLENIKATLSGLSGGSVATARVPGRRGRPKGSKNLPKTTAPKAAKGTRRLSPEGRAAIAAAMKRRWAEHRKSKKDA